MMMRLEAVAKELTVKLKAASPAKQRKAALAACRLATQTGLIEEPIVLDALDQLQQHGVLPTQSISELRALADQLDEKYFDLQDRAEDDPTSGSRGAPSIHPSSGCFGFVFCRRK
jgi:hypothetical protein